MREGEEVRRRRLLRRGRRGVGELVFGDFRRGERGPLLERLFGFFHGLGFNFSLKPRFLHKMDTNIDDKFTRIRAYEGAVPFALNAEGISVRDVKHHGNRVYK